MARVNNEGVHTQSMRMHALKRKAGVAGKIEEIDLGCTDVIMFSSSAALNAADVSKLALVVRPNPDNFVLQSDESTDEQLIIKLNFRDPVSLTHLILRADRPPGSSSSTAVSAAASSSSGAGSSSSSSSSSSDGSAATVSSPAESTGEEKKDGSSDSGSDEDEAGDGEASGPKTVRLWANKPELDFSDADDLIPLQELDLQPKDLDGARIALKSLNFQRINSLQMFIVDNQGDSDVTFINRIGLIGRLSKAYHTDFGS